MHFRAEAAPIFDRLTRNRTCVLPPSSKRTKTATMRVPRSPTTSLHLLTRGVAALALASASAASLALPAPAPAPAPAAAPSAEALEIQRLIKSGQSTQALKLIDEALAKNPKDPAMRFRRGVTLSMLDRKAEALQVFQKLVEDHPEMPAPYNNLAVLYGSQGDYDKARAALVAAIRTNPQYATAYQNLGDVYAQLASQAYSKALQLDKSDTTVPPKLVLLRELIATPAQSAAATAATPAPAPSAKPAQVAVATPAPAPAPVHAPAPVPPPAPVAVAKPAPVPPPAPAPVVAPKPTPAPVAPPKPAPVPPAPAPAPVVAKPAPVQAPAPAPAPAAALDNGDAIAEVNGAVHAWAAAWSHRDMGAYLGAYTPDYATGGKSHKAWEEDRKARIVPRKHIAVEVSDLRVSVNGDKAQAHFKQTYESDTLTTSGHKTLDLVRSPSGKWLIRQESVGG
jgi:ketosteroid isomerase-like protein